MPNKSIAYSTSDEDFIEAVKTSFSIRGALFKLGLNPAGSNYRVFTIRIKKLNLDTKHFTGQGHLKNKSHNWCNTKIPLEEILIEHSNYSSTHNIKNRLIKEGKILNQCNICLISKWLNAPLILHLDHINGINDDHRLENLRLLCPNCHSQTSTYCGKNKNKKVARVGFEPTL